MAEESKNIWKRICGPEDKGLTQMMKVDGGTLYRTFTGYYEPEDSPLSPVAMVFVPDPTTVVTQPIDFDNISKEDWGKLRDVIIRIVREAAQHGVLR